MNPIDNTRSVTGVMQGTNKNERKRRDGLQKILIMLKKTFFVASLLSITHLILVDYVNRHSHVPPKSNGKLDLWSKS